MRNGQLLSQLTLIIQTEIMKIVVFAMLKDYFEKEFRLQGDIRDTATLKQRLTEYSPEAAGILDVCRFAVNDRFVNNDFQLQENDTICIIPPSSGG